jgi:hypothetical protein
LSGFNFDVEETVDVANGTVDGEGDVDSDEFEEVDDFAKPLVMHVIVFCF